MATTGIPQDPYATDSRRKFTVLGAGLAVLAVLLVLGLGFGSLFLGKKPPATVLAVAGKPPSNVLPLAGAAPTPILPEVQKDVPITRQEAAQMPQDVYDWLEHLRVTEEKRQSLSKGELGQLMGLMVEMKAGQITDQLKDPLEDNTQNQTVGIDKFKQAAKEKRGEWADLTTYFESKSPPAECASTSGAYSEALGETSSMMVEILDAIGRSSTDPDAALKSLSKMQGTSGSRIDASAKKTDQLVQKICDKYKVRKWFSIASDVGGGIMDQLGGVGL